MIRFKQIELSDKKIIDTGLSEYEYLACDFCFANLYAWRAQYQAAYSIVDSTLFLRFRDSEGDPYYMMPIGDMPLDKAFELIEADAIKNEVPFQMKKVSINMWKKIEDAMPGQFDYIDDRNNDEYLYSSEKLISLSGKKLQSKRNHINRFKKDYPNWDYISINTKDEIAACKAMLEVWNERYANISGRGIEYDHIAATEMLANYHYLEIKGGMILVDGEIVAFSLGSRLTDETFCVHIEKAFSDVNGAYTIINQQFVLHEASEYKYINREEDLGVENLRKAKMSYYPEILLDEGVIRLKNDKNS